MVALWPGPKPEEIDYELLIEEDWTLEPPSPPKPEVALPRATILSLIQAGLVDSDEILIWRRPEKGEVFEARILASGQIEVNREVFESPSGAAKAMIGRPVAGWDAWRVPRLNDATLGELRAELDLESEEE